MRRDQRDELVLALSDDRAYEFIDRGILRCLPHLDLPPDGRRVVFRLLCFACESKIHLRGYGNKRSDLDWFFELARRHTAALQTDEAEKTANEMLRLGLLPVWCQLCLLMPDVLSEETAPLRSLLLFDEDEGSEGRWQKHQTANNCSCFRCVAAGNGVSWYATLAARAVTMYGSLADAASLLRSWKAPLQGSEGWNEHVSHASSFLISVCDAPALRELFLSNSGPALAALVGAATSLAAESTATTIVHVKLRSGSDRDFPVSNASLVTALERCVAREPCILNDPELLAALTGLLQPRWRRANQRPSCGFPNWVGVVLRGFDEVRTLHDRELVIAVSEASTRNCALGVLVPVLACATPDALADVLAAVNALDDEQWLLGFEQLAMIMQRHRYEFCVGELKDAADAPKLLLSVVLFASQNATDAALKTFRAVWSMFEPRDRTPISYETLCAVLKAALHFQRHASTEMKSFVLSSYSGSRLCYSLGESCKLDLLLGCHDAAQIGRALELTADFFEIHCQLRDCLTVNDVISLAARSRSAGDARRRLRSQFAAAMCEVRGIDDPLTALDRALSESSYCRQWRDLEQDFLTTLMSSCSLKSLTPAVLRQVVALYGNWSSSERAGNLTEYLSTADATAVLASAHFAAVAVDDAVATIVSAAAAEDQPPSEWRDRAAELATALTCESSLRVFKRNRAEEGQLQCAKVARAVASLQPRALADLVEHAVQVTSKVLSAAEVKALADALATLIHDNVDSVNLWERMLSSLFMILETPFFMILKTESSAPSVTPDETWHRGLKILCELAAIVEVGSASSNALDTILLSVGCNSYVVKAEDLLDLCEPLKACANLDLMAHLAAFVQLPTSASTAPMKMSVQFLVIIANLLVDFSKRAAGTMACDAWEWLCSERSKVMSQSNDSTQQLPAFAGHVQFCWAYALLSAADLCTDGCAQYSVNPSLITTLAGSIFERISCIPTNLRHQSQRLVELLIDDISELRASPTHEELQGLVDHVEKVISSLERSCAEFQAIRRGSDSQCTSPVHSWHEGQAAALVASAIISVAAGRHGLDGMAHAPSLGLSGHCTYEAQVFSSNPIAKLKLLHDWASALPSSTDFFTSPLWSAACSMLQGLPAEWSIEVASTVVPVLNACVRSSFTIVEYSAVHAALQQQKFSADSFSTRIQRANAILQCQSALSDLGCDFMHFLYMLCDMPIQRVASPAQISDTAPLVGRAALLLTGQWRAYTTTPDGRIHKVSEKAESDWVDRVLELISKITDHDVKTMKQLINESAFEHGYSSNLSIPHHIIIPFMHHKLLSSGAIDVPAICSHVDALMNGLKELISLVPAIHNGYSGMLVSVISDDEFELRPSRLALLGVQPLLQTLRRIEAPMLKAAFARARALLYSLPELYGNALFDRLLDFWLQVDALILFDPFQSNEGLCFGSTQRTDSNDVDFSAWQRTLIEILSHVRPNDVAERLRCISECIGLCEAIWKMQQDVFVRKHSVSLLHEISVLLSCDVDGRPLPHHDRRLRCTCFTRLAQASTHLYELTPEAPSLIAMVLVWSKNSCPSLREGACLASGADRIVAAAQCVTSASDAGLLLNLLQVHGLRGCEAMQFHSHEECTADALRSISLTRRLEGVKLCEQALVPKAMPLDFTLIAAALDAVAALGLATEETVDKTLNLASLPSAPPLVLISALGAYMELCAMPDMTKIAAAIRVIESRISADLIGRFSELLEYCPLRVGGIAAALAEPELYAGYLFGHNDAPLARLQAAVDLTGPALANTSHTRPHVAFSLHQFAHVPDSLRLGGYWMRWRFLLAHAAQATELERDAASRRAAELLTIAQAHPDEVALDEAFAGAPLVRLAGYLTHVCSKEFDHCRYLNFPLTLPHGSWLFRGIGNRLDDRDRGKLTAFGGNLCDTSIANLLARGCGPADLTRVPPNAEEIFGALWLKVGQTFTSVALEKALGYTSLPNCGAVVAIRADYFNIAQRAGRCRVEKEYAFNPVLYDPVPNFAIERIWLPAGLEASVRAAASGQPSTALAKALVAPVATLSRALQSTQCSTRRGAASSPPDTLLQRLRFLEPEADVACAVIDACPPAKMQDILHASMVELLLCLENHRRLSSDSRSSRNTTTA